MLFFSFPVGLCTLPGIFFFWNTLFIKKKDSNIILHTKTKFLRIIYIHMIKDENSRLKYCNYYFEYFVYSCIICE